MKKLGLAVLAVATGLLLSGSVRAEETGKMEPAAHKTTHKHKAHKEGGTHAHKTSHKHHKSETAPAPAK